MSMKAVIKVLHLYSNDIFFATKKNMDFVQKVADAVHSVDPKVKFRSKLYFSF